MIAAVPVVCPACWQGFELQIDTSGGSARYSEDCPLCCQPMTVFLQVDEAGDYSVDVEAES